MIEEPAGRGPSRTTLLAVALAVSLAGNLIVALRAADLEERATAAEARVAVLESELSSLKGPAKGKGASGPFADLSRAVEVLRALTFEEPVEPRLLDRAALEKELAAAFRAETDPDEVRATGRVLAALGLVEAGTDLFETLEDALLSQVVGFFDPETGDLVALADEADDPSPFTRVTLAHELTHALTAQAFDTRVIEDLYEQRKDDEAYAYLSLLEGDATWVMEEYLRTVLTAEEQTRFAAEGLGFIGDISIPGFLEELLAFPYREGLSFVTAVRERGGPALLDRAYRDPPTSTEQILHPSKYLDQRDEPVELLLPNLAAAMGSGWSSLDRGGFGELDVKVVLDGDEDHPMLPSAEARTAAAGWDGGGYVAASSSGGVVVAIVTAWDSTAEAAQAARAFGRWFPARFGRTGSAFTVEGSDGRGWDAGRKGAGAVVRSGSKVFVGVGDRRADVLRAIAAVR